MVRNQMKKKIVFLTGTRADFGKMKSLINISDKSDLFDVHIFATGMHMLDKYGCTIHEILKDGYDNVYMYNNVAAFNSMELCLANTIQGFSNYIKEINPDMIVVHGDRPEALAGAIVGSFNNIRVAHIEGGELSGTIDGLIRHSISKLAHIHLVSNREAEKRLLQMGECSDSIFKIGSPEVDRMLSEKLPDIDKVKERYEISFKEYSILIYHSVTTDLDNLLEKIRVVVDVIMKSKLNYIVIYPNNDNGADIIFREFERFKKKSNIKMFPSLRFEYFLTLLKNSNFIIGNSSSGVREACIYGVPSINIGTRQNDRNLYESIFNVNENSKEILSTIEYIMKKNKSFSIYKKFGNGKSAEKFLELLKNKKIWKMDLQKKFYPI